MPDCCRICLAGGAERNSEEIDDEVVSNDKDDLFYPCRCKAPVHRRCLDSWRTSGMNPANLTRCEVCQYHYRFEQGTKPFKLHIIFYLIALFQIILFFAIAAGLGQIVRISNVIEIVDWGRLSFMKPDTTRGWFFLGVCFNSFVIGLSATIYLVYAFLSGRLRRAVRRESRSSRRRTTLTSSASWWTTARESRNRSRDCCRDCCHGTDDGCILYCYLMSPDCYCYACEACCGSCDAECTQCCQCMNCSGGCTDLPSCEACGDCGSAGENPCLIVILIGAMALAVVLIIVGMFFLFWTVLVNLLYGLWLNQNYLRDRVAHRYKVLEYDVAYDNEPQEPSAHPGVSADLENQSADTDGKDVDGKPPTQQAMPNTVGKPVIISDDDDDVVAGTLVSVDLTGDDPATASGKVMT